MTGINMSYDILVDKPGITIYCCATTCSIGHTGITCPDGHGILYLAHVWQKGQAGAGARQGTE